MVIDERRLIVRIQRWLTTRRRRPRQPLDGPATAGLPALIAEAADGDQRALRELAAIVAPFVNYYCRVHLGPTEAAQQVAQGISRKILKTLPSYLRSRAPFWGYVYGVTARAVVDAQRYTSPEHSDPVHLCEGPPPASSSSTPIAPGWWLSYSRPSPPSSGKSSSCEYRSDSPSKTPPRSSERPPPR